MFLQSFREEVDEAGNSIFPVPVFFHFVFLPRILAVKQEKGRVRAGKPLFRSTRLLLGVTTTCRVTLRIPVLFFLHSS